MRSSTHANTIVNFILPQRISVLSNRATYESFIQPPPLLPLRIQFLSTLNQPPGWYRAPLPGIAIPALFEDHPSFRIGSIARNCTVQ
ncbi:hypothetical protein KC19_9G068400 [Ceratodon purpureus]|uniref:Uncharacterized protein n=1 Tax=Ceratodon purpureus TaxID=3225 RepID=A0A8T0GR75_CERPU|nr:hypothetical protein KC19_9G068400 [Ceratodon purpureus]